MASDFATLLLFSRLSYNSSPSLYFVGRTNRFLLCIAGGNKNLFCMCKFVSFGERVCLCVCLSVLSEKCYFSFAATFLSSAIPFLNIVPIYCVLWYSLLKLFFRFPFFVWVLTFFAIKFNCFLESRSRKMINYRWNAFYSSTYFLLFPCVSVSFGFYNLQIAFW